METYRLMVLVAILFLGAIRPLAGDNRWTSTGPYGAYVYSMAVDPNNPDVIYVGTGKGIYRSQDGGAHWTTSQAWNDFDWIRTLVIDPTSPSTIYAGDYGALLKSTDGGQTWPRKAGPGGPIACLAIDPRNPLTLYAGIQGGTSSLYRSDDGGDTWNPIRSSGYPGASWVALDPASTSTVYVVLTDGNIYRSPNKGATWSALGTPGGPTQIAIDPQTPTTLYASTGNSGVYKSTDGGTTWNPINQGLTTQTAYSVAISPQDPAHLCVGTDAGVFLSSGAGASWTAAGPPELCLHAVDVLAFAGGASDTIYAGAYGGGVFKSLDLGNSWSQQSQGLMNLNIYGLALQPQTPDVLYAASWGAGIFRSVDGGGTWSPASAGLTDLHVLCLAIHPTSPGVLYAGTYSKGVFKSTDAGTTWVACGSALAGAKVKSIVVDYALPDTVYACTATAGLFKSVDGGATWQILPTSTCLYQVAMDPLNHLTLYLAGCGSLAKSTDGGETWSGRIFARTNAVACDPATAGPVYACV